MKNNIEKWQERVELALDYNFNAINHIRKQVTDLVALLEKQNSLSSEDKERLSSIKKSVSVPPVKVMFH